MNKREMKIGEIYNSKRAGLVARFATAFNQTGADAEEALAKAFESATGKLLKNPDDFAAEDFERLVCWKMRRLLLDAIAAAKRKNGRRSIRASAFLDAEPDDGDDYRVSMIEKASLSHYRDAVGNFDMDVDCLLQSAAIKMVLAEHGISERDFDIVDKIIFRSSNRAKIAVEKKTTVGNVNRIYGIWRKRLCELAPEVRTRYAKLRERCAA